ncbi:HNH endonuclease [Georgenia sp. Z1344]|uniref:HNH endonuclease n=1 Tax=Georgenia sp. Z1344 TaxID=3416706 RepID=UPI003CF4ADB0
MTTDWTLGSGTDDDASGTGPAERAAGTDTGAVDHHGASPGPEEILAFARSLARIEVADQAEAIAIISAAESLKRTAEAAQARASVALDDMRRDDEARRGIPVERQGRGVADEIALARRESPFAGGVHLRLARCLTSEMPRTLELMEAGEVSEWRATLVAKEIAFLAPDDRRVVDEVLAPDLPTMGDRQAGNRARKLAQELDQESAVLRMERARSERRVSVRPAPNGMAYLSALLTVADAVSVKAALERDSGTAVATGAAASRTKAQIAADLLVERVTGRAVDEPRDVALTLVMTDETLLGGPDSAWLPGHGPVPAAVARGYLSEEQASDVSLRRLWLRPGTGQIEGLDSRARTFPASLRHIVSLRDDICRNPFCGADLRQVDHATPWAAGGATSLANASGLCQRCNLAKENPGWTHESTATGLTVTTPTGHRYAASRSTLAQNVTDRRIDDLRARVAANREARRVRDDEPDPDRAGGARGPMRGRRELAGATRDRAGRSPERDSVGHERAGPGSDHPPDIPDSSP